MKYYKIPIDEDKFLYTMRAPVEPDITHCNAYELKALQIDTVVSLLSPNDILDLGLTHQESSYNALGINFIHFPIGDFDVPKNEDSFIALSHELCKQIAEGEIIAIHCRAGIGRSSLLAAAVLIQSGFNPDDVFEHISEHRETAVPDKRSQSEWLLSLTPRLINKI